MIPFLAVGESYNRTRNITIASNETAGNRYLLIVSDRNDNELENNETNNVRAIPIEIRVPDLTVESLSASQTAANLGDTIDISWIVLDTPTVKLAL